MQHYQIPARAYARDERTSATQYTYRPDQADVIGERTIRLYGVLFYTIPTVIVLASAAGVVGLLKAIF